MAPERVCLAYSGGLDTSTILRHLALQGYEIVCFLADCGQEEDFEAVKSKALKLGAERMIIQDVQQELILEQTEKEPPNDMWKRTVDPITAPDKPTPFTVHFAKGVPVKLEVDGKVDLVAYKGCAYVVGRSSETSNLYSEDESSMDTLDMNWTPQDTTGFIAIQGIRVQKYGERKIKDGEPLTRA
ncbi:hypothetical protein E0Z10_g4329 [Xylaria hypoxylon]|uniref:argininosuccinate synthase n=1 Tax=Xylaria hypoxylon TaxID=37992 RepID=A0A4Z0YYB9_9PEZI|nr:hypothetical protein E0Z10_g4329 [Xylaria hypoxylon]